MNTLELQTQLIQKIQATNNTILLEEAIRLFDAELEDKNVYYFSDNEKKDITEARQQIKRGESISHEQANEIVKQWLRK